MNRAWIITAAVTGSSGYDIFSAAEELESIWWIRSGPSKNIHIGDIVYMYVGKPYSKIMYKFLCVGENDNLSLEERAKNDKYWKNAQLHPNVKKAYFQLKKLNYVDDEKLHLHNLNELGLVNGNIQGSFKSDNNPKLFEYIEAQFTSELKDALYDEEDLEYDNAINSEGEILSIEDVPQAPIEAELVNGVRKQKRDARIGRYTIKCARYKCEVEETHRTFISRGSDKPYLESHHLVPIRAQNNFVHSLDVPANIIALCSTCHNEIHYGKDTKQLIRRLHNERRERLEKAGIKVETDELLRLYNL